MKIKIIKFNFYLLLFVYPMMGHSQNLKYIKSDNNTMGHYERLNHVEKYLSSVVPKMKSEIIISINKILKLKYGKKLKSLNKRIEKLELISKSTGSTKKNTKKVKADEIDVIKKELLNIKNTLVGHSDEIRLVKTQLINEGK